MKTNAILALLLLTTSPCAARGLERVRVSDDNSGFVTESGKQFIPWDFNYDRDERDSK